MRSGDSVIVQKHGNGALIQYVHKLEDNVKVDLRKCVGFNNMEWIESNHGPVIVCNAAKRLQFD